MDKHPNGPVILYLCHISKYTTEIMRAGAVVNGDGERNFNLRPGRNLMGQFDTILFVRTAKKASAG